VRGEERCFRPRRQSQRRGKTSEGLYLDTLKHFAFVDKLEKKKEKRVTNAIDHNKKFDVTQYSHCATSRKVAGSIRGGVIGIFHRHNPSGRTIALGSTQPLTEMSTRNIS